MVWSEKTALVWSLIVLIFTIGVASNDVIGLSTNQTSTEGSSVKETAKVDNVLSGRLPESNAKTCIFNSECWNGGSCVYEDGEKHCQCKNGTSGDYCEIVDECARNPKKCGIETDVRCFYDILNETAECKCNERSKGFDSYKKRCRVPCKTSKDCPEHISCRKNRDNDLRFCRCPFGWGGDKCLNKVDECKASGLDCGTNPNVTCEQNETKDAVCYCQAWSHGFNYEVKDCVECNCEGSNLGCKFFLGGEKKCYCQKDYYQKDGKCVACDCGSGYSGCKLENGTKVCNCIGNYAQNKDKCESCYCGRTGTGCSFQNGEKTCTCESDYIQFNGTCKQTCFEWAILDGCKNGGKCKEVCQCLPGTTGDRCELIDGCEHIWDVSKKCGYTDDVKCSFNQTSLTSFCECNQRGLLFDNYDKRCKECDCGSHGNCSFIKGVKTCKCERGYEVNPRSWSERSQCSPCDCGLHSKACRYKSHDSIECTCESGYAQLNDKCSECSCGPHGFCSFDEDGEKNCVCDPGFKEKNGNCEPCDCGNGRCGWNDYGEKTCDCADGYGVKNGVCTRCNCYWVDSYGFGKINCTFHYEEEKCLCPEGYEENEYKTCKDIDECEDPHICPRNTECSNIPGSYQCICKSGYRPYKERYDTKEYGCIDIDECWEYNECPYRDTTKCVNTEGSYYCLCKPGYYFKGTSANIEMEGCQQDQTGWQIGYIILIIVFGVISIGLIVAICRRRSSRQT